MGAGVRIVGARHPDTRRASGRVGEEDDRGRAPGSGGFGAGAQHGFAAMMCAMRWGRSSRRLFAAGLVLALATAMALSVAGAPAQAAASPPRSLAVASDGD